MDFEMVLESSKRTGKKKTFSGWIYFNNYNVFKEFPDMIKRLSLLICRKGKEEEQVNRRSLV